MEEPSEDDKGPGAEVADRLAADSIEGNGTDDDGISDDEEGSDVDDEGGDEDVEGLIMDDEFELGDDSETDDGEGDEGADDDGVDTDVGDDADDGAAGAIAAAVRQRSGGAASGSGPGDSSGTGTSDDDADGGYGDDEDSDADGIDEGPAAGGRRRGAPAPAPGDADARDDGGGGGGGKGASFAKAFSMILAGKAGSKEAAAGTAPILVASKQVAKRQAESAAEAGARREQKKARLERKRRGHAPVPRRGEEPAHDATEKQLSRLATKGVVLLFNAIGKAQKAAAVAGGAGGKGAAKPAKLARASLLAQLKAGSGTVGASSVLGAPIGSTAAGAAVGAAASSWKVLQEGFTGLAGGAKMKDWDRPAGAKKSDNKKSSKKRRGGSSDDSQDEDDRAMGVVRAAPAGDGSGSGSDDGW